MTRFSLDHSTSHHYRESNDHDSLSLSSSSGSSSSQSYSYDYDSEEEEAHPLGFGTTRFGLYDGSDDEFDNMEDLDEFFRAPLTLRKPILNNSKETGILLRHDQRRGVHIQATATDEDDTGYHHHRDEDPLWMGPLVNRMDRIAFLVKAASIIPNHTTTASRMRTRIPPTNSNKFQLLLAAADEQRRDEQETKLEMERYSQELFRKQKADANLLLSLIQRETSQAQSIVEAEKREDEIILEAERVQQRQRDLEEQVQREEDERIEDERLSQLQRDQDAKQRDQDAKQQREEEQWKELERIEEKKKKKEQARAKKTEYITKAHKIVDKLEQVRASLQTFETSKDRTVSKRRLQMKKIARGKMNTLSHDREKVELVTRQVVEALNVCHEEDLALRQQMQAGNTAITRETTRGARYLMDLVASTVVVRVQAEGFNGTRGDGFPLAHMLAHTSKHTKDDFSLLLTAHIYSVCPTAIPSLPTPAHGCSELELMESLGMQKDKKGEYETFDRFLARTEGLISIVAEIMASSPLDHSLFGGHNGALIWLHRFLDLLPPDQSPLPLLTAPVLVAFLTAAGHLLANKFPDKFKPMFDKICNDISKRLDNSAIGQPSATRLSKLISGGFDGLKSELPHGAIRELYDSNPASSSSTAAGQRVDQGHASTVQPATGESFNAFGNSQQSAPTAFSGNNNTIPFGGNVGTFGASTSSNTFGSGAMTSATSAQGTAAPSPFGTSNIAVPSPFGNTGATGASPFGTTPAGASGNSQQPAPTAFLGNTNTAAPFGNLGATATPSAPFGASTSSTPFGSGAMTSATSAQGTAAPSPFGTSNIAVPSPFGNTGATGASSNAFGNSQQSAPTAFSGNNNTAASFGNVGATAIPSAHFGASTSSTPFGTGATPSPSPFGNGNAAQGTAAPSPFGISNNPAPSPFGNTGATAPVQSPFGGGPTNVFGFGSAPSSAQPASTPYGTNNNANHNSKKQPCRFFAQGRCNKGDNCKYSHVMPGQGTNNNMSSQVGGGGWNNSSANNNNTTGGNKKQPCKFFAQGKCRFGANCKNSHDINTATASQGFGGVSNGSTSSGFGNNRQW